MFSTAEQSYEAVQGRKPNLTQKEIQHETTNEHSERV